MVERGSAWRPVGGQWGCTLGQLGAWRDTAKRKRQGPGVLPDPPHGFRAEGRLGGRLSWGAVRSRVRHGAGGLPETGRHRPHRASTEGHTVKAKALEEPHWSLIRDRISVASHRAC